MPAKKKHVPASSTRFQRDYRRALDLIDQGDLLEARQLLEKLRQQQPKNTDLLRALADVYQGLNLISELQACLEQIAAHESENPETTILLAQTCLQNGCLAMALQHYRRFIQHWPGHEWRAKVEKLLPALELDLQESIRRTGLAEQADALDLLVEHEAIRVALEKGDLDSVLQRAEALIARAPLLAAVRNNLAQAYFLRGQTAQAIQTSRAVLAFEPDNLHALGNLVRFLFLSGDADGSRVMAERLKASSVEGADRWLKKAESLSYIGDDAGILAIFQQFKEQATQAENQFVNPMFYHLVAVASLRQGKAGQARRLWKKALERSPGLELARQNLKDLEAPASQRNGPWAFSFDQWLPSNLTQDLRTLLDQASKRSKAPPSVTLREVLDRHPELAVILPVFLERGDAPGRDFAIGFISSARISTLLPALSDFALGKIGSDQQRLNAARRLSEAGTWGSGSHRLWINGEWRDILLVNFEINPEPVKEYRPKINSLLAQATRELQANNPERAETLLKQALAEQPNAPDILNNLAVAYSQQGREEEAQTLAQQIFEEHPDYLFGQVNEAHRLIRTKQFEQASALLTPIMQRTKFHTSEFHALAIVQIELAIADKKLDVARSWFDLLSQVEPDHPDLWRYQLQLGRFSLSETPKRRKGS